MYKKHKTHKRHSKPKKHSETVVQQHYARVNVLYAPRLSYNKIFYSRVVNVTHIALVE